MRQECQTLVSALGAVDVGLYPGRFDCACALAWASLLAEGLFHVSQSKLKSKSFNMSDIVYAHD